MTTALLRVGQVDRVGRVARSSQPKLEPSTDSKEQTYLRFFIDAPTTKDPRSNNKDECNTAAEIAAREYGQREHGTLESVERLAKKVCRVIADSLSRELTSTEGNFKLAPNRRLVGPNRSE